MGSRNKGQLGLIGLSACATHVAAQRLLPLAFLPHSSRAQRRADVQSAAMRFSQGAGKPAAKKPGRGGKGGKGDGRALAKFCRDLCADARAGRLDPVRPLCCNLLLPLAAPSDLCPALAPAAHAPGR